MYKIEFYDHSEPRGSFCYAGALHLAVHIAERAIKYRGANFARILDVGGGGSGSEVWSGLNDAHRT